MAKLTDQFPMDMKKILTVLLYLPLLAAAQPLINEISNASTPALLLDDAGNPQDWLELYNATGSALSLGGFYLTDAPTQPAKWAIPPINLAPGGFLLLYCSGENRTNGNFIHTNFKIDRGGETIYLTNGAVKLDSINPGPLQNDHSMGRSTDGSPAFGIFANPTPGSSNNAATAYIGYASAPVFSVTAGFYASPQTLTLTAGGTIRYTLDGSAPTALSSLYASPLNLAATTVVKARAYGAPNQLPSAVVTETILINETGLGNLPVFSLSLDPADFNDIYNNTVYATNYFPEHIAHIEYFVPGNAFRTESDIDLKLHGTTSTSLWPQKGLRVNCRPFYNNPQINEVLFPKDKPQIDQYQGFNFRMDYGGGGMWDAYATDVSRHLDIDYLACRPAIVFINGQYWGEYQLREKGDADYIAGNHPTVDDDSLDLLRQNYDWSNGFNGITALEGSDSGFFNAVTAINAMTANTQGFQDYFESRFDRKNFVDYLISELYVGNTDWMGANQNILNNIKLWRKWGPSGKWRYILYDCDYAIGIQTPTTDIFAQLFNPVPNIGYHGQVFSKMVQNTTLRNYFINRFADVLNTDYQPSVANQVVIAYRDTLDAAISRHLARWGTSTYQQWRDNLDNYLIASANPRMVNLRNQLQQWFTLVSQVNLTFEVYPPNAGFVALNTIVPPSYPWGGVYFDGAPIDIAPIANPGWQFDHWSSPTLGSNNTVDSITMNFTAPETIQLHFATSTAVDPSSEARMMVFPNPAESEVTVMVPKDWELASCSLVSMNGQTIPLLTPEAIGEGYFRILLGKQAAGMYCLRMARVDGSVGNVRVVVR